MNFFLLLRILVLAITQHLASWSLNVVGREKGREFAFGLPGSESSWGEPIFAELSCFLSLKKAREKGRLHIAMLSLESSEI
jgi:hypothetical protein